MKNFLELINYEVGEGSKFMWHCYGNKAYMYNYSDKNDRCVDIVFDLDTRVVYELTVMDFDNQLAYRWVNHEYRNVREQESIERKVQLNQACDDLNYIDLETSEDFYQKAKAILNGEDFDKRIVVPFELPDDILFTLMKKAHELDITFNQYMEKIIKEEIERVKKENPQLDLDNMVKSQ